MNSNIDTHWGLGILQDYRSLSFQTPARSQQWRQCCQQSDRHQKLTIQMETIFACGG